jgi:hypothetical protein
MGGARTTGLRGGRTLKLPEKGILYHLGEWAERPQFARVAQRLSGLAGGPAVTDHPKIEVDPILPGNDFEEIPLDLFRLLVSAQAKTLGDALDVDVDGDPLGFVKSGRQNDVGRFPGDAGKRDQFRHGRRDDPAEVLDDLPGRALDAFGFIPEKSRRMDSRLEFGGFGFGVVANRRIFLE